MDYTSLRIFIPTVWSMKLNYFYFCFECPHCREKACNSAIQIITTDYYISTMSTIYQDQIVSMFEWILPNDTKTAAYKHKHVGWLVCSLSSVVHKDSNCCCPYWLAGAGHKQQTLTMLIYLYWLTGCLWVCVSPWRTVFKYQDWFIINVVMFQKALYFECKEKDSIKD